MFSSWLKKAEIDVVFLLLMQTGKSKFVDLLFLGKHITLGL